MPNLLNYPILHSNLKGYQSINGVWFPFHQFNEQKCIRLVSDIWFLGCLLYRIDQGYLLVFPDELSIHCETLEGWPLISQGGKLCTTKFSKNEFEFIPEGNFILLQGNQIQGLYYSDEHQYNLADCLYIEDYLFLKIDDWSVKIDEQEFKDLTNEPKDIEDIFAGKLPKPSDTLLKFIKKQQQANGVNTTAVDNFLSEDVRQSHKPKTPQRWRNNLTRFALFTRLSHLIIFRQSKYINSMIKMFEKGNIDEALRHALPLDRGVEESTQQSFGVMKPRNQLSLSEKCYGYNNSIFIDFELQLKLKQLYRQTFEKLAKENRIEEAVFVLIELLGNLSEGIDYLEKNNRYDQAIDIAITREASPETIVRLFCITEQWDKAVMFARRYFCFANAVTMLERNNVEAAQRLRLFWAYALAEKGEWLGASEIIWHLKEHHNLVKQWLNYIDELSAELIVKRIILSSESINDYQAYLVKLQSDPSLYEQRLEIALEVLKHKKDISKLRTLLRMLLNVMVADIMKHPFKFTSHDLHNLIDLADDKLFKLELDSKRIRLQLPTTLQQSKDKVLELSKLGGRIIYDAAFIKKDCYILALGEGGVVIVDSNGKQIKHYLVSTHRFVISYNHKQLLLIGNREDYYKLHKLDLGSDEVKFLGNVNFDFCLEYFDGIHWTIAVNNCIKTLDLGRSLSIIFHVDLEPYQPLKVIANRCSETWLLYDNIKQTNEIWQYSLPEHRLYARNQVSFTERYNVLGSKNKLFYEFGYSEKLQKITIKIDTGSFVPIPINVKPEQVDLINIEIAEEFAIFIIPDKQENITKVYIYSLQTTELKVTINWLYSLKVGVRIDNDNMIFYDNKGRCYHIDTRCSGFTALTV